LQFKRTFIDTAVHDAIETRTALVEERWWTEIRITGIDRWAAL